MKQNDSVLVFQQLEKWDKVTQARDLRMFLSGLTYQIRFYDLRATWATILLSKGVEPIKVMKNGWLERHLNDDDLS